MRRRPGLALPLLVLCCAPRSPAPAPAGAPASDRAQPMSDDTLAATLEQASARRESAPVLALTGAQAPQIRRRAVEALGRVGDPPAIARLLALLADPSQRVAAASALGIAAALGSEPGGAEAAVLAAWSAAGTRERAAIAPALGRLGTTTTTPTLAIALADPDPPLATAAALALGVLARRGVAWDPAVEPALRARAARSSDPALAYALAYALAHAPPVEPRDPADAALLALTTAADPEVRALALVGLTRRKLPGARARAPLQAALADPSPWVQVAAVRGLLALADDDATAATLAWARAQLPLLADPTRAAAAHPILEALERLAAAPLTPQSPWRKLLPAAQAEAEALYARTPTTLLASAACQLAAAAAHDPLWRPPLRCAGNPTAQAARDMLGADAIAMGFDDQATRTRRELLEAGVLAAGFGGDAAVPRLHTLLQATDALVRAAAVTAAGALWTASTQNLDSKRLLRMGLGDESSAVVGAAADAVAAHFEQLKPTSTTTISSQLLGDLVERARRELLGEVELYASLTAALAATGRPEGLAVCQAGLRVASPAARKAARDCVTRLVGDPGPQTPTSPPPIPPHDPASVRGRQVRWTLTTERGVLEIDLDPAAAPWHVAALVALTRADFYDGLRFHRVVPGFVVQGGDPQGTGWGGPGFSLPSEPSEAPFTRGAVGIADAGKDSGGSQFFLMHTRAPHLEGRYTRVGELRRGFEVLDALQLGDRILRAEVTVE